MDPTLGFLSVRQHDEHGYFGGYLIVNHLTRPLEFHCTLPVKPTRAQELLYGSTINDFVCGEQIAKALVSKAKLKPAWVVTDCPAVLALGLVTEIPVAYFELPEQGPSAAQFLRTPNSNLGTEPRTLGAHALLVASSDTGAAGAGQQELPSFAADMDLSEPFQRVLEALMEAHPSAKAA